jgi:hypothetical protein
MSKFFPAWALAATFFTLPAAQANDKKLPPHQPETLFSVPLPL